MKVAGIDNTDSCFIHGQIYVACSCLSSERNWPKKILILFTKKYRSQNMRLSRWLIFMHNVSALNVMLNSVNLLPRLIKWYKMFMAIWNLLDVMTGLIVLMTIHVQDVNRWCSNVMTKINGIARSIGRLTWHEKLRVKGLKGKRKTYDSSITIMLRWICHCGFVTFVWIITCL